MNLKYTYKNFLNLSTHTALGASIGAWFGLLIKNKFKIDIRFLLKVLFITGIVILNFPFQLYEKLRYNRGIKKTKIKKPVFIIGHYRSGTTYLHNLLSQDTDFCFCTTYQALTPNVFLSTGFITKKILSWAMPKTRPQDNVSAGAEKPNEEEFALGNMCQASFAHGYYFPKNIYNEFDENVTFNNEKQISYWKKNFDFFLKKLNYQNPNNQLLIKSPANTARIKEILQIYPNACFIHIHRNPYEVYQSTINLYEKILPLLSFQKAENNFIDKFVLYAYEKMYHKFLAEKNSIPAGQFYEMSYAEFTSNPLDELQKAYTHLSLKNFEEKKSSLQKEITSVKNYQTNSYNNIDEQTKNAIQNKWRFMFEEYGYKL